MKHREESPQADGRNIEQEGQFPAVPNGVFNGVSNGIPNEVPNGVSSAVPKVMEPLNLGNGAAFPMPETSMDPLSTSESYTMVGGSFVPDLSQDMLHVSEPGLDLDDSFSWEMIGLGLEEPMPTQEAIEEL